MQSFLLKIIKLCLYLSLLTPLIFWDRVIYPFVFPKIIFFRIVIEIALFLFIILCILDKKYIPKITWLSGIIAIYIGIAFFTSAFGIDFYQSFFSTLARGEGVFTLLHVFAFFLIASSILKTRDDWMKFFFFFFLIFLIENILAFGQVLKLPYVKMFGATRPNGSFGNPAYFALFEMLGVWITFLLFKAYHNKKWHPIFFATMLLGLVNIYFAVNRASTLGLFLGVILYAILKTFNESKAKTRNTYIKILIAIPLFLALVHFISPQTSIIKKLTYYPSNEPSIKNRLISWNIGWKGFSEKPIFGWGQENYSYVFSKYFDPQIVTESGSYSWYDRAHNTFLEILVANGILGLASFIAIFIAAFMAISKSKKEKNEKNILYSALTSYGVTIFFIFDTISTLILFFFILSYIHSDAAQKNNIIQRLAQKFQHKKNLPYQKQYMASALLLTLFLLYFFNIKPLRASYYASKLPLLENSPQNEIYHSFKKSFSLSPANNYELREILGNYVIKKIIDGESAKNLEPLLMLSIENIQKSVERSPNNIHARLTLSELARIASEINPYYAKISEKEAQFAIQYSPMRYQPYLTLGKLLFMHNKNSEGIQYFKKAADLYPRFIGAHWNLALAYITIGEFDLAKSEIGIMKKIEPSYLYNKRNIANLSRLLEDAKKYDIAISLFQDAIRDGFGYYPGGQTPFYYQELGRLYKLVGKKDLAEQAFLEAKKEGIDYLIKALALNPQFEGAHWNLALAYITIGEFDLAKSEIGIMKKIEPSYLYNKHNIANLSRLLEDAKKHDMAISLFQDAIRNGYGVNAKNEIIAPYYYQKLGELYLLVGKKGLAEEMFALAKTAKQKR